MMVLDKEKLAQLKEENKAAGENIRKRRIGLNLSQDEVGEYVGVNRATVQRYESGEIEVKKSVAQKLAKILKTTPQYVLGWQSNPEPTFGDIGKLELSNAYLSLAKDFQDEGIDPEDIKTVMELIKRQKK